MTARRFVDTNVWVYCLDGRDQTKQATALRVVATDPASIVVSTQVMGELFVTLQRLMRGGQLDTDPSAALDAMRRFHVVDIEAADVAMAVDLTRLHGLSYWDALIVATARRSGCTTILTEDLAHGTVIAGVAIENPFGPDAGHRLSERRVPYAPSARASTFDDAVLRDALVAYAAACERAGMRRSAAHSYWDYARRFLDWREGVYPRGTAGRPVPAAPVGIEDLRQQIGVYVDSVTRAGLGAATVETYQRHASFFVRWLDGDFEPGSRLR